MTRSNPKLRTYRKRKTQPNQSPMTTRMKTPIIQKKLKKNSKWTLTQFSKRLHLNGQYLYMKIPITF